MLFREHSSVNHETGCFSTYATSCIAKAFEQSVYPKVRANHAQYAISIVQALYTPTNRRVIQILHVVDAFIEAQNGSVNTVYHDLIDVVPEEGETVHSYFYKIRRFIEMNIMHIVSGINYGKGEESVLL